MHLNVVGSMWAVSLSTYVAGAVRSISAPGHEPEPDAFHHAQPKPLAEGRSRFSGFDLARYVGNSHPKNDIE